MFGSRRAFTLIELLVVMGILAVLATATALIINPAAMLAQGRDSTRVKDIGNINDAFQLYELRNQNPIPQENKLYISLPDSSPTCTSYSNLPALPSGWQYVCKPNVSYRNIDSSGWIPVDFSGFTSVKFDRLPVDPKNNSNYFYAYTPGRLLTAAMESTKFLRDVSSNDGGNDLSRYEVGNFSLSNQASNLIGYWSFSEGSGSTTSDSSGNNNNGTLTNGPAWTSSGKVGNSLIFDGVDDYVALTNPSNFNVNVGEAKTLIAWFKGAAHPSRDSTFLWKEGGCIGWSAHITNSGSVKFVFITGTGSCSGLSSYSIFSGGNGYGNNEWHFFAGVIDRPNNKMEMFLNGSSAGTASPDNVKSGTGGSTRIGTNWNNTTPFNGIIDEARIYNRALTQTEIQAIYNAQK